MAEKHLDQLREILARAAARDAEQQQALETLAPALLKELGGDDKPPVWAEVKAVKGERQLGEHFVLQDGWVRGDLVLELAPGTKVVMSLRLHTAKDGTHEVGLAHEASQTVVVDAPDEKRRDAARKALLEHIFADLETQVRQSVAFPRSEDTHSPAKPT